MPGPSSPQVLAVAGSGRSGTSLFTGLTGRLGLHIPKPEVSANRSNPRGFGEPRWLVDFHNELLESTSVMIEDGRPEAWDETAAVVDRPRARARLTRWYEEIFEQAQEVGTSRIVVKDPRLAWFIELHRAVLTDLGADLRVATMLRDPAEVMKSREVAYGTRTPNTTRVAGWFNQMLGTELRSREHPRATIRYVDLLDDWRGAIGAADDSIGLELFANATDSQVADATELVDPNLRRSVGDWDALELPTRMRDLAERAYGALDALVGVPADGQAEVRGRLDDLRAEYTDYYTECADVSRARVGSARSEERRKVSARLRAEFAEAAPPPPPPSPVTRAAGVARRAAGAARRRIKR